MKKIHNTGYWEDNQNKLYHVCDKGLCSWVAEYLKDQKSKKLYDFGCGLGHYLKPLSDSGFTNLTGFEGAVPLHKEFDNIVAQDLTKPFTVSEKGNCLCLEVGEHIPARFEKIFLDNLTGACDDNLIMSWAVRGQDGEGHVNCLNNDEAIARVESRGFKYLTSESEAARNAVSDYPWFKNTTLVFKRV